MGSSAPLGMAAALYRHISRSFSASPALRWWPPTLARPSFPLMAAPNPPIHRASRFSHGPRSMVPISSVPGDESVKPYRRLPTSSGKAINVLQGAYHSAITQAMTNFNTDNSENIENIETKGTISLVDEYEMRSEKDASRTTSGVINGKHDECGQKINLTGSKEDQRSATKDHTAEIVVSDDEEYTIDNVLPDSRHGDGSIYRDMDFWWKKDYRIADRNETRVKFTSDCVMVNGSCINHSPCTMMQIFSIELAKLPVDGGLVELYGYIAVRDNLDRLLNYVVNISRDDPTTLEEGSLIKMVGPKRGIYLMDLALLEYDIRIKTGEQEKDDLPLIDGASIVWHGISCQSLPYKFDISSDCGAVDITLACIDYAVESTIEVLISEVQSRFNLSLGCLTSGLNEEISLFDGVIAESCGLKRFVVAVIADSLIDLKFKVGPMSSSFNEHCCSFEAKTHGHDTQEIKTGFGLIMVKLTWSTLR